MHQHGKLKCNVTTTYNGNFSWLALIKVIEKLI